jgi:hypothetical protein
MKRASYLVSLSAMLALAVVLVSGGPEPATPAVQVGRSAYHGWPDAGVLCSKQAEVVIVPAIGWIMSFGLLSPKADGGNTLPDILI